MKISLVQMNSVDDKPANLAQAKRLIEQAVAEERPDWIQLPEVFDFLGGSRTAKLAAAEVLPAGPDDAVGPAYGLMRDLARKHGVFIHAGSMLEAVPWRGAHRQYDGRLRPPGPRGRALSQDPSVRHHDAGRDGISGERNLPAGRRCRHL